ncbi:hypothetical protein PFMALIP_01009 [Plasmodium falciparum MaliPS096_E11]|uniref:RRM domain-containing protein n=1 Tax=Plasmodium falciparum MaliPS096_E11 TaxID=1036727 RepID=A0A024WWK6_PLAFA|nr:hypothetical protein PFMALIP_01009 [Plasmodium falciparum MaliPS096_E11]
MFTQHKNQEISHIYERNNEATLYIANLDAQVDEEILCELFMQCGNVKNVHIPRDKINGYHAGYGFVEYEYEYECEYAANILNMTKLFGKALRCNKATQDKRSFDVGANLFIGNLDDEVDEKMLFDIFSSFGQIMTVKVMRNEDDTSKGHGFISYDNFESSDLAIENMNNQFICNKKVHISYAFKKDSKGERHGTAAERFIAANKALNLYPLNENNNNNNVNPSPFTSSNDIPLTNNTTLNLTNNVYLNNTIITNNIIPKLSNDTISPIMNNFYPPNPHQPTSSNYLQAQVGHPTNIPMNARGSTSFMIPPKINNRIGNILPSNISSNLPPNIPPNLPPNFPPNFPPNLPPNLPPTLPPINLEEQKNNSTSFY